MALEYKKFDLDDKKQKETFEDLLSRLTPKDVVELKMFERLGFGKPHNVEVHIVFNGDYTKVVSKKSIVVPFDEIKKNDYNLSIARYKEDEQEEVKYEKPKVIIGGVLKLEDDISKELNELKRLIE